MARPTSAAGLLALACTSGCGFSSLTYLTSGADEADASLDASNPQDDAVGFDSGPDATTSSTWCLQRSPVPFFCADFDEGDLTFAYQRGHGVTVPAPLVESLGRARLVGEARSAPGAFSAAAPEVLAGGAEVHVRFDSPVTSSSTTGASLRFDVRLPTYVASENAALARVVLALPDGSRARAYYSLAPSGKAVLLLQLATETSVGIPLPAVNQWATLQMEPTLAATVTVRLLMDGQLLATLSEPSSSATAMSASFSLGLGAVAPSAPVEAVYDNVVFSPQ